MASKAIGFLNFKFGADLSGFERAMKKAQKGLKKFGKSVTKTGQNLSTNLTLPIVALGGVALKTFGDFEQGMLKVKAISGATTSEFQALTESAKELGSTTMFTASQVAELQLNLSKLGFDPESILSSSQAILNLAQATDSDLAEAATVAASTMNAFGLEAKDMTMISDVMADSFSSSALDLQKFQTAMASVAPVAKQAGQDIQGTSAILGVLVNNGIEASSAGTALRNVFLELANKGLTWDEAMIKIQASMNPLKTAMDLFGKRGAAVATIIANNGTEIQALTDDFNDSAGEAQKMADIMDSGVGGAFRKLQSQLEGANIELGEKLVPIFMKVAEKIKSLIKSFTDLDSEQQKNIVKWGLIVAAIGPILIIIGKMSIGISALIPLFTKLGTFLLANPWIAAAAAIGVLVYAIYDMTSALRSQIDVEKEIGNLNNQAQKSIVKDIINIEKLTGAIKDENTSLDDQKTALKTLKETYPGYYDAIDETTISTQHLDAATETLTTNLMKVATLTAYQDKLVEIRKEMLELENTENVDLSTKIVTGAGISSLLGPLGTVLGELTGKTDEFQTSIQKDLNTEKLKELAILFEKLLAESIDLEKEVDEINKTFTKVEHNTEKVITPTGELADKIELVSLAMQDVSLEADIMQDKLDGLEMPEDLFNTHPLDKFRGMLGILGDEMAIFFGMDIKEMEEAIISVSDKIGDNLAQGADSFEEYGNTVKGILREIIGGIISQGVAAAVSNALSNPALKINPFLIPVLAGAAAGLARTAFNSLIPAFADGGIISGPTVGLMGEYPGASSNPEVVAPLDKLKSMMGTGNQNIIVEGRLVGNDIYLSNERTKFNRNRTV